MLGMDGYTNKKSNLQTFYEKAVNVSKVDQDSVSNVLLEATTILEGEVADRHRDAVSRLENLQPG